MANSRKTLVAHWRNWVARTEVDPVANGNDGVEVVELGGVLFPICRSYSEFPNNCILLNLTTRKYVFQMLVDGWDSHVEQFGHQLLSQPDSFVLVTGLDAVDNLLRCTRVVFGDNIWIDRLEIKYGCINVCGFGLGISGGFFLLLDLHQLVCDHFFCGLVIFQSLQLNL
ncbi:MAG: hypothetical protein Q8R88_14525 [Desulfoprunum sp.]|nr:hypothetical protein [Desulfoprunum sp.]